MYFKNCKLQNCIEEFLDYWMVQLIEEIIKKYNEKKIRRNVAQHSSKLSSNKNAFIGLATILQTYIKLYTTVVIIPA